jgi:hypothetical protein
MLWKKAAAINVLQKKEDQIQFLSGHGNERNFYLQYSSAIIKDPFT